MRSFPGDKFATAVSMEKNSSTSRPVLLLGKLLFKEKLANEKSIDSTYDLAWRKIRSFCEILRYDKRNRNATSALRTSILGVEKLYISSNINTKKTFQRKSFDINF